MDCVKWKNILLQWAKATDLLETNEIEHIEEANFKVFYGGFRQKMKIAELSVVLFIEDNFPDCSIKFDDAGGTSPPHIMFIFSLFLYYSCVKNADHFFQGCCNQLDAKIQLVIANFFRNLVDQTNLTKEVIRHAIQQAIPVMIPPFISIDSPIKTPQNKRTPPTPTSLLLNEKQREIKLLQSQLDGERFDRGYLEMQQKQNEEKIDKLMREHKKHLLEIQNLKAELLNRDEENMSPNRAIKDEQNKKRLRKQIVALEDELQKSNLALETALEDNKNIKEKLVYSEKHVKELMNKTKGLEEENDDLKQTVEAKSEMINCMMENQLELESCLRELRKGNATKNQNSSSIECLDVSFSASTNTTSSNVTGSPENLGRSVVDLMLRENQNKVRDLEIEICQLTEQMGQLNRNKESLTQENEKLTEQFKVELEKMVNTVARLEIEKSDLADSKTKAVDELKGKIADLEVCRLELESEMKAAAELARTDVQRLQSNIQECSSKYDNFIVTIASKDSEITDLKSRVNTLNAEVSNIKEKLALAVKTSENLVEENQEIQSQLEFLENEKSTVQVQLKNAESHLKELTHNAQTVSSAQFVVAQQLADKIEESRALEVEIQVLKKQLKLQEATCKLHTGTFEKLQVDFAKLKSEFNSLQIDQQSLQDELKQMGALKESQATVCTQQKEDIAELRQQLDAKVQKESGLVKSINELREELKIAQNTIRDLKQLAEKAEEDWSAQVTQMERQAEEKNSEIQSLQIQLSDIQAELSLKKNALEVLTEESSNLSNKNQERIQLLARREEECKKLEASLSQTQEQLRKLKETHDLEIATMTKSKLIANQEFHNQLTTAVKFADEIQTELDRKLAAVKDLEEAQQETSELLSEYIEKLNEVEAINAVLKSSTTEQAEQRRLIEVQLADELKHLEEQREANDGLKIETEKLGGMVEHLKYELLVAQKEAEAAKVCQAELAAELKDLQSQSTANVAQLLADKKLIEELVENLNQDVAAKGEKIAQLQNIIFNFNSALEAIVTDRTKEAIRGIDVKIEDTKILSDIILQRIEEIVAENAELNNELNIAIVAKREVHQANTELEVVLELLREETRSLKATVEETASELQTMQGECKRLIVECSASSVGLADIMQENAALRRTIDNETLKYNEEREQYISQKREQEAQIQKLEIKIRELAEQHQQKSEEVSELSERLLERATEVEKMKKMYEDVIVENKAKVEGLVEIETKVSELTQQHQQKTEKLSELSEKLGERTNEVAELKKKVEKQVELEAELSQIHQQKSEEVAELSERLAEWGKKYEEAIFELKTKTETQEELETKLTKFTQQHHQKSEEVSELSERLLQRSAEVAEVKKMYEDAIVKQVTQVEVQIELETKISELTQQHLRKSEELCELNEILAERANEVVELKKMVEKQVEIEAKVTELSQKHQQKSEEVSELSERLVERSTEVAELKKMYEDFIVEHKTKVGGQVELEIKVNELTKLHQQKSEELCELSERLAERANEVAELKKKVEKQVELEAKVTELYQKHQQKCEEVSELSERLAEWTKKYEEAMLEHKTKAEIQLELETKVKELIEQNQQKSEEVSELSERLAERSAEVAEVKKMYEDVIVEHKTKVEGQVELEIKVNELTQLHQQKSEESCELSERLVERANEVAELKKKVEKQVKLEAKVTELSQKHQQKCEEVSKLSERLAEWAKKYEEAMLEHKTKAEIQLELETKVKELIQQHQQKSEEVSELSERLAERSTEVAEVKKMYEDVIVEHKTRVEGQSEVYTNERQSLLDQNQAYLRKIQELISEKEAMENEIYEIEREIITKNDTMCEKMLTSTRQPQLSEKLNTIKQQVHNLNLEKSKFIDSITDLDRKLETASNENYKLQDKCAQLQESFEEATQMRRDYDQKVEKLEKMLADSETNFELLKQSAAKTDSFVAKLKADVLTASQLKSEYDLLKIEHNRTELEKKALANQLAEADLAISLQKERNVRLEALVENADRSVSTETSRIQELSKQMELLKMDGKHVDELEKLHKQEKELNAKLQTDVAIFQAKLIKERQLTEKLEKEIAEERKVLHDRVAEAERLSSVQQKDIRLEMEGKLEKMKEKMKTLYNEELSKAKGKYEKEINDLRIETQGAINKAQKYEMQADKISQQMLQMEHHNLDLKRQYESIKTKLSFVEANSKMGSNASVNRMLPPTTMTTSASVASNAQMGSNLRMEDEEGECFNNTYLTDLKMGRMSNFGDRESMRLSEIQMRNSMQLPHLRSAYAPQYLEQDNLSEDIIKNGALHDDSMSSLLPTGTRKKLGGTTSYKRPGPPTPSKNGGRLSFGGGSDNQPHYREVLKEPNTDRNGKKSTPGRKSFLSRLSIANKTDEHRMNNMEDTTPSRSIRKMRSSHRALKGVTSTPKDRVRARISLDRFDSIRRLSFSFGDTSIGGCDRLTTSSWRECKTVTSSSDSDSDASSLFLSDADSTIRQVSLQPQRSILRQSRLSVGSKSAVTSQQRRRNVLSKSPMVARDLWHKRAKEQRRITFNKYRSTVMYPTDDDVLTATPTLTGCVIRKSLLQFSDITVSPLPTKFGARDSLTIARYQDIGPNDLNNNAERFEELLKRRVSVEPFNQSAPAVIVSTESTPRLIYSDNVAINRRIPYFDRMSTVFQMQQHQVASRISPTSSMVQSRRSIILICSLCVFLSVLTIATVIFLLWK